MSVYVCVGCVYMGVCGCRDTGGMHRTFGDVDSLLSQSVGSEV